jgi:hypothetical protein
MIRLLPFLAVCIFMCCEAVSPVERVSGWWRVAEHEFPPSCF